MLKPEEKMFCIVLANTNSRLEALKESGRLEKTFKKKNLDPNDLNKIRVTAHKILQNEEVKEFLNELLEEKYKYLKESGVASQIDVLKFITGVMDDNVKNKNHFYLETRLKAAKLLLDYYSANNKLSQDNKDLKEAKKFIVEYTEMESLHEPN